VAELKSEISGRVIEVSVAEGDAVEAGQQICLLESMKMEVPVEAPAAGKVRELLVEEDDVLTEGQTIAILD
jgi:acetyl-CoA carboxylase biotin carboxyl carrier protein